MSWQHVYNKESFVVWTGSNAYPIAKFQCVSWADSSEISAAVTAGIRDAIIGRVVVPTPVGTVGGVTVATRRVIGVTLGAQWNGLEVPVATQGIVEVMVNAAIAQGALVFPVARTQRTSAQTPWTNLKEGILPQDPRLTQAYEMSLIDDTAVGTTATYYPLGYAVEAATNQYDVIPVELDRTALYV